MKTPENHLAKNDLNGTLKSLQEQVRTNPADSSLRIFLFQLLAVMGQWERALTQLNVIGDMDDSALAMVVMYRQVLTCEAYREEVFAGKKDPVIFGDPSEWVALLIQALKLTAEGRDAEASELRRKAFDDAPATPGKLDGKAFDWIADGDSRLGPMLEVILEGRYLWVPFNTIADIVIEPPEDLRDTVWLPSHFIWSNGGESHGLIPTRYPRSFECDDDLLALSKKTVWKQQDENTFLGLGQRMFLTDQGDFPLMDVRSIQIAATDLSSNEK